jgi:integrase
MGNPARKKDYLFQRPQSANWYVRYVDEKGKRSIKSLGTSDRDAAKILAKPYITGHERRRFEAKPHFVATPYTLAPGEYPFDDGVTKGRAIATEREIIYLAEDGKFLRSKANNPCRVLVNVPKNTVVHIGSTAPDHLRGQRVLNLYELDRPELPRQGDGPDDPVLETYITQKCLPENREREAREMWRIFRAEVGKRLKDCTRDDGRKIVAHLGGEAKKEGREAKSATLRRRMVPLVAAVNLAISEGKHNGINPFVSVVPDRDDEDERDAFNDDDVKTIKANLDNQELRHKLDANEQLLLRIVATTGMRRGEAFQIAREQVEDGIRYCVVGTKTAQSLRRIPFPRDLLPFLPEKITAPLLTGRQDSASKRLTEFLEEIGVINDDDGRDIAPMHSFRHRAKNRLRDTVPDDELRDCIGGWKGKKNSGRKYGNKHGAGYSIQKLKAAIDEIGF